VVPVGMHAVCKIPGCASSFSMKMFRPEIFVKMKYSSATVHALSE
jgi:hypothetical protein